MGKRYDHADPCASASLVPLPLGVCVVRDASQAPTASGHDCTKVDTEGHRPQEQPSAKTAQDAAIEDLCGFAATRTRDLLHVNQIAHFSD